MKKTYTRTCYHNLIDNNPVLVYPSESEWLCTRTLNHEKTGNSSSYLQPETIRYIIIYNLSEK